MAYAEKLLVEWGVLNSEIGILMMVTVTPVTHAMLPGHKLA